MSSTLKSINLVNFRSFRSFSIKFTERNFLVGPNNAGKTTILTALRLADIMIRYARSRNPNERKTDDGLNVNVYPMPGGTSEFQSVIESIHHDFEETEARIVLTWKNDSKLVAVWPPRLSEELPYFYLLMNDKGNKTQPTGKTQVINNFSRLGIIPILAPLEYREQVLKTEYVKINADSRIATKHFRNNINVLKADGQFEDFLNFIAEWLPEIEIKAPEVTIEEVGGGVNLYYREQGQATQKEIIWSGDGIQIWLQILFHIFRIGSTSSVILDEPEVYLHSDLQRRLVKLIDSLNCQVILATHSTEVIAEATAGSVIMIDKSRKKGLTINTEDVFEELTSLIGASVDLRLVRSLRTKVTFFVEGQDMKLLNIVSKKLNLKNIFYEQNISNIQLGGKSNYVNVMPFQWLSEKLFGGSKVVYVLLDRDYQSDEEIVEIEKQFTDSGIHGHIWRQKELESYFITPKTIAKVTGLIYADSEKMIKVATEALRPDVVGRLVKTKSEAYKKIKSSIDISTIASEVTKEVEANWHEISYRMKVCPAKEIIKQINAKLQSDGMKSISATMLADAIDINDIDQEMKDYLVAVDHAGKVSQ